ncbi:MAG: hypothetical protein AMXMBFR53_24800 [Gemmatimonadota bacterium]
MALDHALAELTPAGEGALRLYRWEPHTISFGRNEPTRGVYDVEEARREGLGLVRRPTGGRAVLHAREVTYCAVLPVGALGGLRRAYVRINEGLVEGLRRLGCPAEVSQEGSALPPSAGPCFQAPAPGEVVLGGRKLVGSAQVRVGRNILQHGSVILAGDQSALGRLGGAGEGATPPATLEGTVGPRSWEDVARALSEGVALALGGGWRQGEVTPEENSRARTLETERYATDDWTWRR